MVKTFIYIYIFFIFFTKKGKNFENCVDITINKAVLFQIIQNWSFITCKNMGLQAMTLIQNRVLCSVVSFKRMLFLHLMKNEFYMKQIKLLSILYIYIFYGDINRVFNFIYHSPVLGIFYYLIFNAGFYFL